MAEPLVPDALWALVAPLLGVAVAVNAGAALVFSTRVMDAFAAHGPAPTSAADHRAHS
jgi:hypothetical protein